MGEIGNFARFNACLLIGEVSGVKPTSCGFGIEFERGTILIEQFSMTPEPSLGVKSIYFLLESVLIEGGIQVDES